MSLDVLVVDVECSSLDPAKSEVLELAVEEYRGLLVEVGESRGEEILWRASQRFRPEHPDWMDPRSTAVHKLTAEVLAEEDTFRLLCVGGFKTFASGIIEALREAKVIIGYNVDFDLRMIDAQLALVSAPAWDRTGVKVVDVMKLWTALESRKLESAVRRFLGRDHVGAHGAAADVTATAFVLESLLSTFEVCDPEAPDWGLLLDVMEPRRAYYVGSRHLQWERGQVVVTFGKMQGTQLIDVDNGYLTWMLRGDFPAACKEVVATLVASREGDGGGFFEWVREKYPEPAV